MHKYVREMLPSLIKISEKQQQQNLSNRSNKLSINFVWPQGSVLGSLLNVNELYIEISFI